MDRDAIWVLAPIGAACWMLGGTNVWPGKLWRRALWPIIAGVTVVSFGHAWWLAGLMAVGMFGAHTLPYSPERHGRAFQWGVGFLCGLALAPGLYPLWGPILSAALTIGFALPVGLTLGLNNWWTHKWTEGMVGWLQGGFLAWALLH